MMRKTLRRGARRPGGALGWVGVKAPAVMGWKLVSGEIDAEGVGVGVAWEEAEEGESRESRASVGY